MEYLELAELIEFEHETNRLLSVHKSCGPTWDWTAHANGGPPPQPTPGTRFEAAATAEMRAYMPSVTEKLFGGDKKRLAALADATHRGRAADESEYAAAYAQYQSAYETWTSRRALAGRLLARDATAYLEALNHARAFEGVVAEGVFVTLTAVEPDLAAFECELLDDDPIPHEEVRLTPTGKVSTVSMPTGKYCALYQDFVCSSAIRVARETFAVLPISRVIVNLGREQLNTSTGHPEHVTLLAVHFLRNTLDRLNLKNIDPSDSMRNFDHRMAFSKSYGLEIVPPITPDEQWVTT